MEYKSAVGGICRIENAHEVGSCRLLNGIECICLKTAAIAAFDSRRGSSSMQTCFSTLVVVEVPTTCSVGMSSSVTQPFRRDISARNPKLSSFGHSRSTQPPFLRLFFVFSSPSLEFLFAASSFTFSSPSRSPSLQTAPYNFYCPN